MQREDFFKLRIRDTVYYKGEAKTICYLWESANSERLSIEFNEDLLEGNFEKFEKIMHDLSFDPPKQKTKYYQWIIQNNKLSAKHVMPTLLSEDGYRTNGDKYPEWKDFYFKQKIEPHLWEE